MAPITLAMSALDTVVEVADQAGDISRFPDPGTLGYDAWMWPRGLGFAAVVDADRAGVAEKVRVTARSVFDQELTVTRGPSPLAVAASGWWIVAAVSADTIEQIDDRIFDLVAGELVRDINVEMADLRADDAEFAGKPWFDVTHTDFGATGDGVTDDGPAVEAAMDAAVAIGGGVVYFPRGTYLLTTWTATGYSPGGSAELILLGDAQGSLIQGDGTDDFLDVDAVVVARNLEFTAFGIVFNLNGATGTVDRFEAADCKSSASTYFVRWDTPGASAKYTRITIARNRLLTSGEVAISLNDGAVGLGWDGLDILDNFIDGGASSTMYTGIKVGYAVTAAVDATQALWNNIRVAGNVVRRVNGDTGATGATHSRGIVVYGTQADISGNRVETVDGDAAAAFQNVGIQAGIRYGAIRGNQIRGISGTVLRNVGILLYGTRKDNGSPTIPYLHSVDVSGNTVTYDAATVDPVGIGLQFGGSELSIHDNHVFDAEFGVYGVSGTNTQERLRVVGNTLRLVTGGSGMIFNGGGSDWRIDGNVISGGIEGVRIVPTAGGLSRVSVSQNQIDATTDGIILAGDQAVSGIVIVGNHTADATDGVQLANSTVAPDEVLIALNDFQGATNLINITGLAPTNYRAILSQVQDSRAQTRFEHDLRVGDGAWDGEHLILGTRRFWVDTSGAARVKASVPASSLDGLVVGPYTSSEWDGAHPTFGAFHLWVDTGGIPRIKSSAPASSLDGSALAVNAPTYLENSITSSIQITGGGAWVQNNVTVSGALPGEVSFGEHENNIPQVIINTVVDATDNVRCTFVRTGVAGSVFNIPSGTQRAGVIRS